MDNLQGFRILKFDSNHLGHSQGQLLNHRNQAVGNPAIAARVAGALEASLTSANQPLFELGFGRRQ